MNLRKSLIYSLLSIFIVFGQAFAWGPDGHHTVGAIADKMIAGTHADTEVKAILGNLTLRDVAVWADCAKGIDPRQGYTYQTAGKYKECKIFENPEEEARMRAFVLRNEESCDHESCQLNDKNCDYKACHTEYHYADIAVQHNSYSRSYKGTRDDDIVNAVVAAMHVLNLLTGMLTITDNRNGVTGSTQTVSLSGTGTGPIVSMSGPGLGFVSQVLNTTSTAQTETLTNTGTANLTISTVTVGGANASDFAKISDTCTGATVTPNSACTVSVTSLPVGSRVPHRIAHNAGGSPQTVSLTGTGVPSAQISPSSVTFAGQAVGRPVQRKP